MRASGTVPDGAGYDGEIALQAAGATLEASALGGTGLAGTDLAGTDLAGAELAGTGQDATETAPLAVLSASSDRAVSGLGRLAEPHGGALGDGAADDDEVPGRQAPVTRSPRRRPPSHSRRGLRAASTTGGSASDSVAADSVAADSVPADSVPAAKRPGVARGLLVTPWFAAATGFVIAASLWIYSPHPQLAYPAISIGKAPCSSSGCKTRVEKQGGGSLTMNSGEPVTPSAPAKAGARTGTGTAASGLTFDYVVRPASQGRFQLIVSVASTKNWRLSFVLPGDHIEFVIGAHWQAVGSDGGIASPLTGDQGQQNGGPGNGGGGHAGQGGDQRNHGYAYGGGAAHDQPGVSFTVIAAGRPPVPTHCSYDGASCRFHELSSMSQGWR